MWSMLEEFTAMKTLYMQDAYGWIVLQRFGAWDAEISQRISTTAFSSNICKDNITMVTGIGTNSQISIICFSLNYSSLIKFATRIYAPGLNFLNEYKNTFFIGSSLTTAKMIEKIYSFKLGNTWKRHYSWRRQFPNHFCLLNFCCQSMLKSSFFEDPCRRAFTANSSKQIMQDWN